MGLFDTFKRKKKDDYLEMDTGPPGTYGPASFPGGQPQPGAMPGMDAGMGGMGVGMEQMPGMPPADQMSPQGFPGQMQPMAPAGPPPSLQQDMDRVKQQLDTLNYKLDTLKAVLDTINTRLANIESALRTTPIEKEGWTY